VLMPTTLFTFRQGASADGRTSVHRVSGHSAGCRTQPAETAAI
jgi:hypothetical protein